MADIYIKRMESGDAGTFGEWYSNANEKLAVTVERPPTGDHPCIPLGTYQWKKFFSPHNGPCLLLLDVPGRSMIEIHSANIMLQLLGCLAPGEKFGSFTGVQDGVPYTNLKGVLNSKQTLKLLLGNLPEQGTITIT